MPHGTYSHRIHPRQLFTYTATRPFLTALLICCLDVTGYERARVNATAEYRPWSTVSSESNLPVPQSGGRTQALAQYWSGLLDSHRVVHTLVQEQPSKGLVKTNA